MNNCIDQEKMWGVVVKYNKERGYGFIRSKVDGIDYFVHISQVKDELLERGYIVEFCVGLNIKSKREEAKNVIVIEKKANDLEGGKVHMKENNKVKIHCGECDFVKMYNCGNKIYYCDHEDRIDDMGKLGMDHLPKKSPDWCPLRNN
jgi:cold shock CspA family protein